MRRFNRVLSRPNFVYDTAGRMGAMPHKSAKSSTTNLFDMLSRLIRTYILRLPTSSGKRMIGTRARPDVNA